VGYTTLMAQSEEVGLRLRERHRTLFGSLAQRYRGEIVDENGDELVLAFSSAVDAVNCALAVQAELQDDAELRLRVGIHQGDVIFEGGRVYGDGVNVASRIRPLAEPGGVCVSEPVYDSVKNQPNVSATSLGVQTLKNVARPMEVFGIEGGAAPAPTPAAGPETSRPRRVLRRAAVSLTAIVAVVAVIGLALWATWPRPLGLVLDLAGFSGPPENPPLPDQPSIAVLPFTNMSGDPEQEYFSDGMTEDLTTELSRHKGLFVISRNSAFTYKGRAVKVEDVGRELGVRYVLEGSVRREGERLRITAQLIDATSGFHVWSERYDRELTDVFALQAAISQEIQAALRLEVFDAEYDRVRRLSNDELNAYDVHLQGMYHFLSWTREGIAKSAEFARRSMALDPNLADNYTMLAGFHLQQYLAGWDLDPARLDRAQEWVHQAIDRDPKTGWGLNLLANIHVLRGNPEQALALAERAIDIAPNQEFPHIARALALGQLGRVLESIDALNLAMRLNPREPAPALAAAGYVNYLAGRKRQAEESWERARRANAERIPPRLPLAWHYELEGRHAEARAVVQEILQINPEVTGEELMQWLNLARIFDEDERAEIIRALRRAGLP